MPIIDSLQQLIDSLVLDSRQAGPCPFCAPEGQETIINGTSFYGKDRFFLFPDRKGWGCRVCMQKGHGPTGKGWYPHNAVAEKLGVTLSDKFKEDHKVINTNFGEENPLTFLTYNQVLQNHKKCLRDFWYLFGWTDEVIDRFKLGYGTIEVWKTPGHLIPMDVTHTVSNETIPGFYTSLRAGKHKLKQRGSSKNYVWHVQDDPYLDTCVIVEGEKDLISAWAIGHKNVLCTFSSYWNSNFGNFVASRYKNVIIYSDWDENEAGERWQKLVLESLQSLGVTTGHLLWSKVKGATIGDDLTDYLSSNKGLVPSALSEHLLWFNPEVKHNSTTTNNQIVSLEEIRGEGEGSLKYEINHFLTNYRYKRGSGNMLLLSVGPGAGKTHTLFHAAEKQALFHKDRKQDEYNRLLVMFDELVDELSSASEDDKVELIPFIEKQRKLLDEFSFNSVAWYAPYRNGIDELLTMGADPKLWYDFKARSKDNCDSYETTSLLGENNHAVGEYCKLSCPFADKCNKSGYLFQKEEMKSYPIVFYRHEHLINLPEVGIQTVFVDESITKIVETPQTFSVENLSPFNLGWELDVDEDFKIELLEFFILAVKSSCSHNKGELQALPNTNKANPNYILFGNQIFRLLEKYYTSNEKSLADILLIDKDLVKSYQPTYLSGDIASIKPRCLPSLIEAVQRELPIYLSGPDSERPSTIFIVAGMLEVYSPPRVKLPARIPLIVADATPMLELYKAIFQREMRVYSPVFRSDETEIIVIGGSDWSRTHVKSQLGKHMETWDSSKMEDIPTILDGYFDSSVFSDLIYIFNYLKKKHKSLLMVTHKNLRELVESVLEAATPSDETSAKDVSWGHYGSLRGTNKYKDYEALCLIGAFRIPYDVLWRRAQVWAYGLGLEESIPSDLVKQDCSYNVQGNSIHGKYITFNHWLADKLVHHVEQGEMIQCAHRIRPHSSPTKKTIYIFATRPVTDFATMFIEKHKFLRAIKKTTYSKLIYFLQAEYSSTGRLPTYKDTKEHFKVSNSTIKEAREEVVNESKAG